MGCRAAMFACNRKVTVDDFMLWHYAFTGLEPVFSTCRDCTSEVL